MSKDKLWNMIYRSLLDASSGFFPREIPTAALEKNSKMLAEAFNTFIGQARQAYCLAVDIAAGDFSASRHYSPNNHLLAPLSQLSTQLNMLGCSITSLLDSGQSPSLPQEGKLFEDFNRLSAEYMHVSWPHLAKNAGGDEVARLAFKMLPEHNITIMQISSDGELLYSSAKEAEKCLGPSRIDLENPQRALHSHMADFIKKKDALPWGTFEVCDNQTGEAYVVASRVVGSAAGGEPTFVFSIQQLSGPANAPIDYIANSAIDPLTKAYTKKIGMATINSLIRNSGELESCAAIVKISGIGDLDNDDQEMAIKGLSIILHSNVRDMDIVAREGYGEFLVLFTGCGKELAEFAMDRVKYQFDAFVEDCQDAVLELHAGIVKIGDESAESVCQRAKEAMSARAQEAQ